MVVVQKSERLNEVPGIALVYQEAFSFHPAATLSYLIRLKKRIHSTHIENCMARIKSNTEGKLRIFRTFKQDYCMEGYLLLLPNVKHMSTIARFRMSSHTLAIETGRHAKPKIAKEERKCRYCNLDDVEDEKHFLLKCPLYNKEHL